MAKDLDALNEVYTEILGAGVPLQDEEGTDGSGHAVDGAYEQEDYSDEAGDGNDPRDDDDVDDDDLGTGSDDDDDGDSAHSDDDDGGTDDDEEGFEEIPERLVDAGRLANLSDEAIVEISESRPEVLEALARAHENTANTQRQVGGQQQDANKDAGSKAGTQNQSGFEPIKLDITEEDEEDMSPKALTLIKSLTETVNKLGGQVNEQANSLGSVQQQSQSDKIRNIDSYFDKLSDDIPGLGKSNSLTEKQKQNRVFAFSSAQQAMRVYGITGEEEALAMGANSLKGQMTEAQVKKKLVQDLDRNKKRFTARGRSRQRSPKKQTTQQRAMAAIDKVLDSEDY